MAGNSSTYSSLAPFYDALFGRVAHNTFASGIGKDISDSALSTGKVLDVGSGTGLSFEWLREVGDFEWFGYEPSLAMRQQSSLTDDQYVNIPFSPDNLEKLTGLCLVISNFDTVNLLSISEFEQLLSQLALLESAGILFIFDVIDKEAFSPGISISRAGNTTCTVETSRESDSIASSRIVIEVDGREAGHSYQTHYLHSIKDLELIGARVGWAIESKRPFMAQGDDVAKYCMIMRQSPL